MTSINNSPYRILVIDDTNSIHEDFKRTLEARSGRKDKNESSLNRHEEALFGDAPGSTDSPLAEYELDSAMQGQEGLELVRRAVTEDRRYAVAFVDMRMPPGWDGLQTIERLWEVDPCLQVVICTAFSDYSWADIKQRIGVTDRLLILKKPFEQIEVSQIAMALCEKWSMTHAARLKLDQLEAIVEKRTSELRYAATHDRLTGLANREHLTKQLRNMLHRRDHAQPFAVLCLDFDRFKLVNDSLGHDAGDALLQEIATRLNNVLAETKGRSLAARMGGDEFIVLLDEIPGPDYATELADRLLDNFRRPFTIKNRQIHSTASIGIVTNEMDYAQTEDILRHADLAMYRAKSCGRDGHASFDQSMHDEIISRVELEQYIRQAVAESLVEVHYQPIVCASSGNLLGMEALGRLATRDGSRQVSPADFIPIMEELGLINEFGEHILRQSLGALSRWQASNPELSDLYVNVNLSKCQLVCPEIVTVVQGTLDDSKVDPSRLQLEITESIVVEEPSLLLSRVSEIRRLGVRIAMDDFGTGLSSLSCLRRFPFDALKIDRSFITSVSESIEYAAIVQAIITLADNLRMQVIAEGVETQPQLVLVQAMDCPAVQGFYFSKPMPEVYWSNRLKESSTFAKVT